MSHRALPSGNPSVLARVFQRMFTRLGCSGRPPQFTVDFYPYAGLAHTIRLREDTAFVRISDLLRSAPLPVVEATAAILLGRLYRRSVPAEIRETYRKFVISPRLGRRLSRIRSKRGRRQVRPPRGASHDLSEMFGRLNETYFDGTLNPPRLGWSIQSWNRQLGCFDPALDLIVINSRLDRESVPACVVEYVLYHEMLHVKHPMKLAACGLQSHSPAFRKEEKRFRQYAKARSVLRRLT